MGETPDEADSALASARRRVRRVQLALAIGLFLLAWLAVVKVPLSVLWEPAIGVTEWGFLVAGLALLLCLPGAQGLSGKVACGLAVGAALLALSPWVRALAVARRLPDDLEQALGTVEARALPGAPARPAPLVFSDLLRLPGSGVETTTHVYREAEGVGLHLDLYQRADAPRPQPLVVMIHGGSWRNGDPTQLPAINRYLAARGYAVAAIAYRLAPRWTFPAAHDDVLAAVRYLQAHAGELGLDPERVVLAGRSAGGHLALLAGYAGELPGIRGVIAYYPPTDLEWSYAHPSPRWVYDSAGSLEGFLGGPPDEERLATYREASPLRFVQDDSPPTLLIHGLRDQLVYARQSERLAERLAEVGVLHLHLVLPWATHGCDANLAGPSGQLSTYAIERFLAKVTPDAP